MRKSSTVWLILLVAGAVAGRSQDPHQHGEHHSPYADQEASGIAALSAREVENLESGAGMGLARAAELNHYPGPKHVLELAASLSLSAGQSAEVEEIRLAMLAEARRLGAAILEKESLLDRRFAHRHIDEAALRRLTGEIGALQGELRFVHLVAHLRVASILTREQIDAYDALRGYGE